MATPLERLAILLNPHVIYWSNFQISKLIFKGN